MTDRPIIFSAPMVQALLAGRKSMTRRVLKPQPPEWVTRMTHEGRCGWIGSGDGHGTLMHVPYAVGDRLWCREVFAYGWPVEGNHQLPECNQEHAITYRADGNRPFGSRRRWHSPIHMPRWASRLTLTVTDVRVQRLQEISEADAVAEGMQPYKFPGPWWQGYRDDGDGDLVQQQYVGETPPDWMIEPRRMKDMTHLDRSAVHLFTTLWNDLHGPEAWAANPWVAALTFETHRQNIDQMEPTND